MPTGTRFLQLIPMGILRMVFAFNVLFLLLLGFSYPFIEPGTPSYVAAVLTLVAVGVMLTLVTVLYVLKRRSEAYVTG